MTSSQAQAVTGLRKPCLIVNLLSEAFRKYLSSDTQAAHIMLDTYDVFKSECGYPDYISLQGVWPHLDACSLAVVDSTGLYWHPGSSDEKGCLEFLLSPEQYGIWEAAPHVFQHILQIAEEGLQNGDSAEASSASFHDSCIPSIASAHFPDQKNKCVLSVRLMEGGSAKAKFNATDCLKDVKRWLLQELNLLLIPEENYTVSRYTNIGHFEPSRYAFFYPATRKTFSEAQELVKLEDLGLCPRLALILRPDYDENEMKAAREAENNTLKNLIDNANHLLQALYSFFDYRVNVTNQLPQDDVDYVNADNLKPPKFLAATGPATSASLINAHGIKSEANSQAYNSNGISNEASSLANGENIVNV